MAENKRTLDLTIISAKSLNKVKLIGKMDVYAVAYVSGNNNKKQDQKQKTRVNKDGDTNPNWNCPMKFIFNESIALQESVTLIVKIKTEGLFGDKDVGKAYVPVKELLERYNGSSQVIEFVSYEVRKPSGKPKGELSFSYKFNDTPDGPKPNNNNNNNNTKVDEPTAVAPKLVIQYPPMGYGYSRYPPIVQPVQKKNNKFGGMGLGDGLLGGALGGLLIGDLI